MASCDLDLLIDKIISFGSAQSVPALCRVSTSRPPNEPNRGLDSVVSGVPTPVAEIATIVT